MDRWKRYVRTSENESNGNFASEVYRRNDRDGARNLGRATLRTGTCVQVRNLEALKGPRRLFPFLNPPLLTHLDATETVERNDRTTIFHRARALSFPLLSSCENKQEDGFLSTVIQRTSARVVQKVRGPTKRIRCFRAKCHFIIQYSP